MKFVITGGAGFIGSHIAKHLVEKNHDVTIVDNLSRGRLENLSKIKEQIEFKKIDILDFNSLKNIISNSDGIFHQAALTSVPESFLQKEKYHNVNVKGTENIFKLAKEFGKKVVYASSSSIYGNTTTIPIQVGFFHDFIYPTIAATNFNTTIRNLFMIVSDSLHLTTNLPYIRPQNHT